ncbi:oxygen-independent coproporphyrinogen III oxidase [Parvularcula sp. LCG005]|uniref:oxygen-independent coproporphyrinogen III oxidase n=1 Tax=Parvularcula sp. LCG005 TaxID=3078805 RepID=UPI00294355B8|nr:oxygen-independent coproporphyrinogen III oxidase [Parvularcula sp. LCG005]WOI54176.1 oxygen-independent coproporphyrinogen III oxidase [Parvularcula sp. LCG005]
MKPAWHPYLQRNVPRYTSYPSALAFSEDVGTPQLETALSGIGQYEPISLYLHIPFCKQLCWYCGCNMRVENRDERIAAYADDLISELGLLGAQLAGRGRLTQVHFGGGTPNTLQARDLERLLAAIEDNFRLTDATPVAMEIDPRLCSAFQAAHLVRAGINRFSIGVQDFHEDVQRAINRVQPFELVRDCVAMLRQGGVRDISLDLLYGLPKQTGRGFADTVSRSISLAPDRISLFGYAHLPARLKHQRLINERDLPSRDERTELAEMAAQQLEEAGYQRIGFDHFALPTTPIAEAARRHTLNRNFQGYTEDCANVVIGAGVSAISSVHGTIVQNAKDLRAWQARLRAGALTANRGVIATLEEEDLGDWIKRLLCDMRASLTRYFDIIQADGPTCEGIINALQPFVIDGIISIDGDDVVVAREATPLARVVAAVFDPHVNDIQRYASPAV